MTTTEERQLWRYVALREFAAPPAPLAETVHKGLRTLWRRFARTGTSAGAPSPETSRKASGGSVSALFGAPDWSAPSDELRAKLAERFAAGQRLQAVVGGPHRATPHVLRHLAHTAQWQVVEAPTPADILERRSTSLDPVGSWKGPVIVIPQLAHWFLRHHDGLDLVRAVLERTGGGGQRVVVGCHSWAWAYLDKAIHLGSTLPDPIVLAPFDGAALGRWLRQLAVAPRGEARVFREAATGRVVVAPNEAVDAAPDRDGTPSTLLAHIAAHSRGNPEIAWSLWHEAIERFDRAMLAETALKTVSSAAERTAWVPSWTQLALPKWPSTFRHLELFLMHNLLLHDGLPADVLPGLMLVPAPEIQRGLRELEAFGLAGCEDTRWRVTAPGYPCARETLDGEGYLVDCL